MRTTPAVSLEAWQKSSRVLTGVLIEGCRARGSTDEAMRSRAVAPQVGTEGVRISSVRSDCDASQSCAAGDCVVISGW